MVRLTPVGVVLEEIRCQLGVRRKAFAELIGWSIDQYKSRIYFNKKTGRARAQFWGCERIRDELVIEIILDLAGERDGGELRRRLSAAIEEQALAVLYHLRLESKLS